MSSGPIPYPTSAGEDPQRGPQGRERACGRPRTRYRALAVSCNAIPEHARTRSPKIWGWSAAGISSRCLSAYRREASGRAPPDPRVVVPEGMSGALQPSAPASSPPPRDATRSCRTARAQASSGPDDCRFGRGAGMRWLRRVFGWHAPTSGVRIRRPGATIWYRRHPRTQHLAVGHAFPCEGLSWHRTLDGTEAGRGG